MALISESEFQAWVSAVNADLAAAVGSGVMREVAGFLASPLAGKISALSRGGGAAPTGVSTGLNAKSQQVEQFVNQALGQRGQMRHPADWSPVTVDAVNQCGELIRRLRSGAASSASSIPWAPIGIGLAVLLFLRR